MSNDIKKSTIFKYKIKEQAIELSLKKLSMPEISNLNKCITEAICFVMAPLRNKSFETLSQIEINNKKLLNMDIESLNKNIKSFEEFLKINILYNLVVKKHQFIIIGKSSSGVPIGEVLSRTVEDSFISFAYTFIPNDLCMQIGREQLCVRTPNGNYINSLYSDKHTVVVKEIGKTFEKKHK